MMEERRPNRFVVFYPIFLALMLVMGIWIGQAYNSGQITTPIFIGSQNKEGKKVQEILDLIEREYVDTVDQKELVEGVIQDLLQELDPHSYYISAEELQRFQEPLEGNFDGIGVEFMIQEDTVVVIAPVEGGPSESVGILAGDRIVRVEEEDIAGIGIKNQDVIDRLRGERGTKVNVGIMHSGSNDIVDVEITRAQIPIYSVAVSYMVDETTGYIKLSRFARTTYDEFYTAAKDLRDQGMEKLVFDLRGNGGGYLDQAAEIGQEFLNKGDLIVYTEGRKQDRKSHYAKKDGEFRDIELAVLIDQGSASASEIVAGALQDNDRGTIIGRRSFGKGLVQEHVGLPDGSALRLTIARYYTPTGRCIQRPYGEGIDYDADQMARYDSGELISEDSLRNDEDMAFTTPGGKTVYGGGGITPDIFVPVDTVGGSLYLSELSYQGIINQFAFDQADKMREELGELSGPEEYQERYKIDETMLQALIAFAEKKGLENDPEGLATSKAIIETRLKAYIARNIWNNKGYYPIILESDPVLSKAMEVL